MEAGPQNMQPRCQKYFWPSANLNSIHNINITVNNYQSASVRTLLLYTGTGKSSNAGFSLCVRRLVKHVQFGRWQLVHCVQLGNEQEHLTGNDVDQQRQNEAERLHYAMCQQKVGCQERQPQNGDCVDTDNDELSLVVVGRKTACWPRVHGTRGHESEVDDQRRQEASLWHSTDPLHVLPVETGHARLLCWRTEDHPYYDEWQLKQKHQQNTSSSL